ncbi:P-type conjugative transfer protein TrbG [Paremcibacter congregatus]|nr:P-type conjugative transfer protein TrbG [Paremcibacter congregatus]QDE26289.1 P-type conjugative transfer protein TrbG [Paremcibacter congregatus]
MKHLIMTIPLILLTACAGSKKLDMPSPPEEFAPAIEVKHVPDEVKIIEVPKILALPGQLKELSEDRPDKELTPIEAITQAQKKALWKPNEGRYFNAIQHYPYAKGALYQLYTSPEHVSDISLEAGESLKAMSAGDTVRWIIGDMVSGTGAEAQVHILVKPIEAGLSTNLVIITDRRSYYLELKSLKTTYMAALSWSYPQSEMKRLKQHNILAQSKSHNTVGTDLNLNELNFAYSITGDTPDWKPYRAFDDGQKVYIEFPRDIATGEAPPLFVLGKKGQVELVNYRMKGRYYVVDRLFKAAELRLGEDPQQKITITRKSKKQIRKLAKKTKKGA